MFMLKHTSPARRPDGSPTALDIIGCAIIVFGMLLPPPWFILVPFVGMAVLLFSLFRNP